MKKIFTLIFALVMATGCAYAQSLTLSYEGTAINSGDTLEVVVPILDERDFWLAVTNVSEEDVMVVAVREDLDVLEGAEATFCFAGNCYLPHTLVSQTVMVPSQSTLSHETMPDNAFHLTYTTPVAGVSYIKFTFANEDDMADNAVVIFKLVSDPTNIVNMAVATKMRAYPNPASENVTIEYAYTGNSNNVKLVIKNLLGATLLTKSLDANGNRVKVDLSEYNAGIYFYSIEADGRPLVTKKLLVK